MWKTKMENLEFVEILPLEYEDYKCVSCRVKVKINDEILILGLTRESAIDFMNDLESASFDEKIMKQIKEATDKSFKFFNEYINLYKMPQR